MVQLNLLSGPQAGARWVARRLPICLGRSSTAQIQLDAPGVWDEHARLDFTPQEDFRLRALGDGFLAVNGALVCDALLRNGDRIRLGSAELQFWLAETRQRPLWWREGLAWMGIVLFTSGQLALLYWLLR